MAHIINGKQVAATVIEAVKQAASDLERTKGVKPGLAVVIVGDDPASHAYLGAKGRVAKEGGFDSIQHTLRRKGRKRARSPGGLSEQYASIHAIPAQLPLRSILMRIRSSR
ncbi:tetrahydrofolate dehydrogenase/cyclohydrolase catalytic domain-containing protein [Mesorhizobium norvegicum]|uniref:tetrahydrofolate dehydrogenase/cyclohydrolase catalytic domain-containing protein n=1 Tax=Mesorhizobium sp. 10.2.3 TaxID=1085775 RepID=UPI00319DCF1A